MRAIASFIVVVSGLQVASSCGESTACPPGSLGCPCAVEPACQVGLQCQAGVCVRGTGGGTGGGASGGGAGGGTNARPISFTVPLAEGAFWDYRWTTRQSSYGMATSSSGGTFRVALGAARTFGDRSGFPVTVYGSPGEFRPRWQALSVDGGFLGYGGEAWTPIINTQTSLVAGGGFFATLPSNTVFLARENVSFSNAIVSGRGIVLERSASTSDVVCVGGQCFNGSDPETNLTQKEFYLPGIGPAGYTYTFSLMSSSTQSTTHKEGGLVAASLRGDQGLFTAEVEPNDSPSAATQSLATGRALLGSFSTQDQGTTLSHTYRNPNGVTIGTASDRVQDCYRVAVTKSSSFELTWDKSRCAACRFSVVVVAANGTPVSSTSLFNPVFTTGSLTANLFDSYFTMYGRTYAVCVGTSSATPVEYSLAFE
ncbi:MAG: hypothetical protein JNJ54_29115 [Myxococcaceae bacterium]|nr:hypothetical protein [Myxococcaceae bacterium]